MNISENSKLAEDLTLLSYKMFPEETAELEDRKLWIETYDHHWHPTPEEEAELERRVLLAGVDLSVLKRISPTV